MLARPAISIQDKMIPARSPPPVASKAKVALVLLIASTNESLKAASEELQTYFAPKDSSNSTCSCFLTILTKSIPSSLHIFTSICPKLDAAAV